ncbi:MAG: YhbY family RNA-binding protein [Oscillospiraceae bacterium]|nr:YhbY family RNA-binding protein [Ruminococcus sp.]MBQ9982288.1 YhbY family RNA-binding protein [Oscillospiraceae bacterium]MBR6600062.1 YhbY family RNA-binding protein [Oscillospiraceae bacterium]
MLTSKQRAKLKGISSKYDTIFQIGKGGISETLITQVNDALRARELIKLRVLENSAFTAREAAEEIASKTGSEVVHVIGSRFVLYKRNPKDPVIDLKD